MNFTATTLAAGSAPVFTAQADLNGDGKLDLVSVNFNDGTASVYLGNGDGTFQTQKTYNVGSAVTSIAIADFNGDGIPDLAVGYDDGVDGLSILQGNGDGTFQAAQAVSAGNRHG